MKSGDTVQLKSPAEILATLDERGCLDGQPFMPEMLEYFGRTFRVSARAERACNTITPEAVGSLPETVVLDDLRCSGAAHGGCQARCLLYWKEAWLKSPDDRTSPSVTPESEFAELERLAVANALIDEPTVEGPTYSCQATQFPESSKRISFWSVRSPIGEVIVGNVSLRRFIRTSTWLVLDQVGRRLGLRSRTPFRRTKIGAGQSSVSSYPPQEFAAGELVRVRSSDEIAATLDERGKNRGLWFDREMLPYCGTSARVVGRVNRFVNERTGQLVELKSDCYILEGIVCKGERSIRKCFCCRRIYPWWRACWLEKLEDTSESSVVGTIPGTPRRSREWVS